MLTRNHLLAALAISLMTLPAQGAISFIGLGDLPGGGFFSTAYGVSGDGTTVVGEGFGSAGDEAFRWTADAGMAGLGDLPGDSFASYASGVSGDGTTVLGFNGNAGRYEAWRVDLGPLPVPEPTPLGMCAVALGSAAFFRRV